MKTKKRVVNKKLTTEHPAVREAREFLYLAELISNPHFKYCLGDVKGILTKIIKAK